VKFISSYEIHLLIMMSLN